VVVETRTTARSVRLLVVLLAVVIALLPGVAGAHGTEVESQFTYEYTDTAGSGFQVLWAWNDWRWCRHIAVSEDVRVTEYYRTHYAPDGSQLQFEHYHSDRIALSPRKQSVWYDWC
jgi:hypothetical protein